MSIFLAAMLAGGILGDIFPEPAPRPAPSWPLEEARLARMVNAYRADNGLPPVPFSPSLTRVAKAHVHDLMENDPRRGASFMPGACNMHSWSAAGPWKPVCYTADHAEAELMWSKPREITRGRYPGNGYEIAYFWSGTVTPEIALKGWEGSRSHDALLLELGPWEGANWQAMGVGMYGNYAVVWFGKERDPDRRK